jgi:hypothetical protein
MRSENATVTGENLWNEKPVESVFIPVKEMLSNAPGFRSLYVTRQIHFEEVYSDIIDRALLPFLHGPVDHKRKTILKSLEKAMAGKVTVQNEEFFLRNKIGNLEFPLLAEGIRKIGLIWVLVQNGTLLDGSVLCWDEPEANLNPRLIQSIVEILLRLQRMGVQIFIATHDYVFLKELDLQREKEDEVSFHSLFRCHDTDDICVQSTKDYLEISPNTISDTFADLYDRDIQRALSKKGQQ